MNKSLVSFIAFLAVLLAVIAIARWWVGPVAGLVVDGDKRSAPYYLLVLDKSGRLGELDRLVAAESGEVLYAAELDHMLGGLVRRDEWQHVRVYRFALGADFLKLATSEGYRAARRGLRENARLILGTSQAPEMDSDAAAAVWLTRRRDGQILEAHSALLTTAADHGGQSAWHADLEQIEGDSEWESLRVVAFDSVERAFGWHEDPFTRTEVVLMQARYADSAGLLYAPGR